MEEAAEVLESEIVTVLTGHTEHLILIGDHKQLRPKNAVYELSAHYKIDISLFERLIKNELPFHQLKEQRRMRPCISSLLRPLIYEELSDHPSVEQYEDVKGIEVYDAVDQAMYSMLIEMFPFSQECAKICFS